MARLWGLAWALVLAVLPLAMPALADPCSASAGSASGPSPCSPASGHDGAWSSFGSPQQKAIGAASGVGMLALLAFAFKGALMSFFSRVRGERVLQHPVRKRILQAIRDEPGVRHHELARRFGNGSLEHHLDVLGRQGLVEVSRLGNLTSYSVRGALAPGLLGALPLVRSPAAARLLACLDGAPLAASDLARRLGLSLSTTHYHRSRLEAAGLVRRQGRGALSTIELTPLGTQALALSTG